MKFPSCILVILTLSTAFSCLILTSSSGAAQAASSSMAAAAAPLPPPLLRQQLHQGKLSDDDSQWDMNLSSSAKSLDTHSASNDARRVSVLFWHACRQAGRGRPCLIRVPYSRDDSADTAGACIDDDDAKWSRSSSSSSSSEAGGDADASGTAAA